MSKKEALHELLDEIVNIEETLNKARSVSWCLMNGYFFKIEPDENILILYYEQYKEIFFILDDYLIQMKLMLEELYKENEE